MPDWKHRWICPHWEFLFYQEDAPDLPFSERTNEGAATFVDILNTQGHNVNVRVDFYGLDGVRDHRFGLEGIVSDKSVWAYRTDTGPNFPKPAPGQSVTAQGWFQIRATERVWLSAYVVASKYTARSRAWAFSLPIYEWPYTLTVAPAKPPEGVGTGISPAPKPRQRPGAKPKPPPRKRRP